MNDSIGKYALFEASELDWFNVKNFRHVYFKQTDIGMCTSSAGKMLNYAVSYGPIQNSYEFLWPY